jgi:hypothetical protein
MVRRLGPSDAREALGQLGPGDLLSGLVQQLEEHTVGR